MASTPTMKTITRVTRDKLGAIFKSLEFIKAFENLQADVAQTIPAAIQAASADEDNVITQQVFAPRVAILPPEDKAEAEKVLAMSAFLPHQPAAPQFADAADKVLGMAAFLPKQPQAPSMPDDMSKVLAMAAYLPRVPSLPIRDDGDASRILASQIFGG